MIGRSALGHPHLPSMSAKSCTPVKRSPTPTSDLGHPCQMTIRLREGQLASRDSGAFDYRKR